MHLRKSAEIKKISILCSFAALYLLWVNATGLGIPCPIHLLTGLRCPGCGMTRAFVSLCHFHFHQAFRYNILSVTLVPLLAVLLLIRENRYIRTGKYDAASAKISFAEKILLFLMLLSAFLYGILRNIGAWQNLLLNLTLLSR